MEYLFTLVGINSQIQEVAAGMNFRTFWRWIQHITLVILTIQVKPSFSCWLTQNLSTNTRTAPTPSKERDVGG